MEIIGVALGALCGDAGYPWDDAAKRGAVILITVLCGCGAAFWLARRK